MGNGEISSDSILMAVVAIISIPFCASAGLYCHEFGATFLNNRMLLHDDDNNSNKVPLPGLTDLPPEFPMVAMAAATTKKQMIHDTNVVAPTLRQHLRHRQRF